MLSGDIFEFNGDRFVARAKTADGWLSSRMVTNDKGEQRPTVGKPRLFRNEQCGSLNVVGKYSLTKKPIRSAPPDEPSKNEVPYIAEDEKTPEQLAEEAAERRLAVERLIQKTSGNDRDNSSDLQW